MEVYSTMLLTPHILTRSIYYSPCALITPTKHYDLNLEFDLNEDKVCKYSVKSIGLDLDLLVRTKELEIYDNRVYIKYELFNDQKSIGEFEYKLIIRE